MAGYGGRKKAAVPPSWRQKAAAGRKGIGNKGRNRVGTKPPQPRKGAVRTPSRPNTGASRPRRKS